jgi:hypothetical protein
LAALIRNQATLHFIIPILLQLSVLLKTVPFSLLTADLDVST